MNKLINLYKINLSILLVLNLIFFSCSKDDEIVNDNTSKNKTPKYNNGIFFTLGNDTSINSKIHFFNLDDRSFKEIYSSITNNIVSIDGDKTFYYLSSQKEDNQGNNSIIVKDVETFKDVTTITNNINYPKKVISYNNKLFIVNNANTNSFNSKPFISIFTKDNGFSFEKKINLPENTRATQITVVDNKLYIILNPLNSLLNQSILIFNLQNEQIEANITKVGSHNKPGFDDIEYFENELYVSISPSAFSFLPQGKQEVYKLSGTTLNLTYEITNTSAGLGGSIMSSYKNDFYITFDEFLYKRKSGNTNLQLVYTNDKNMFFLHFLNSTEFLVLESGPLKLFIKDLNNKSVPKELATFSNESINSIEFFKQ